MVKKNWIEDRISKFKADKLEEKWSDKRDKQLQYLLKIYITGEYNSYSVEQINEILDSIHTKYSQ